MEPHNLTDGDLLAYLDGDADPDIVQRIAQNAEAQVRLHELAQTHSQLDEILHQLPRPSTQELGEYHLGLLPEADAQAVAAYLQAHPHAAQQQDLLQEFLTAADPAPEPHRPDPLERVAVFVAQLIEGGHGPQLAGAAVRGAREEIYQVGDFQLVLASDVDADSPTQQVLTGILLGAEPAGMAVHLWRGEFADAAGETTLDDLGNFTLKGLDRGLYQLIISRAEPRLELHVQNLQIE